MDCEHLCMLLLQAIHQADGIHVPQCETDKIPYAKICALILTVTSNLRCFVAPFTVFVTHPADATLRGLKSFTAKH